MQISIEMNGTERARDHHIHADLTQDEPAPQGAGERRYTVQYRSCKDNGDDLERSHGKHPCKTNRHIYIEFKYKTCDSR